MRTDKVNYYLDIAATVSKRSTCLRRKFGAVIINNDAIISTGYNGAPRGRANCDCLGYCIREKLNIKRGERYEMCRSVHAEQNAIIQASRNDCLEGVLYLVGYEVNDDLVKDASPCMLCKKMIINAGIKTVVVRNTESEYTIISVEDWILEDDSLNGEFGY